MKNIKDFNLIDLQSEMESIGKKKFRRSLELSRFLNGFLLKKLSLLMK